MRHSWSSRGSARAGYRGFSGLAVALAALLGACAAMQDAGASASADLAAASTGPGASVRSPEDEIIYFVLPDRFENGDPKNDRGGMKGGPMQQGGGPKDRGAQHLRPERHDPREGHGSIGAGGAQE